jgi:hypothetical protein
MEVEAFLHRPRQNAPHGKTSVQLRRQIYALDVELDLNALAMDCHVVIVPTHVERDQFGAGIFGGWFDQHNPLIAALEFEFDSHVWAQRVRYRERGDD